MIETVKYQVLSSILLDGLQRQQDDLDGLHLEMRKENRIEQSIREGLEQLEAAIAARSAAAESGIAQEKK